MQPSLGALHSEPDYRDGIAAAAAIEAFSGIQLLPTYDTDLTKLGEVMMQGQQPACVSYAWAMVMKWYWFVKTGKVIDFEPRFLHILSRGTLGVDDGRVPRTVAKVSVQYGCCTKASLSGDVTMSSTDYCATSAISPEAYAEAKQYALPGYMRVPLSQTAMRGAVQLYGAISGLFQIGSEFWLPSWADKDIDPLRTPAQVVSGHELVIKGWGTSLERLRNHWSAGWADMGEANFDWSKWSPYIFELWAPAEIPADTTSFLKTLPAPSDFHYQWNTNMAQGTVSDDVRFAQIALMILGFLPPLTPDDLGHYGPKTAVAVSKYQQANRISPSPSNIGPLTRAALNAAFAL